MHSNSDLALGAHRLRTREKSAGVWASLTAWIARISTPSRPAGKALAAHGEHAAAPVDMPISEQEFATEREALAYSASTIAQGFRTVVEQSVYDYSWHVEVYPASTSGESRALAA